MKNVIIATHFELEELISDAVKNALQDLNAGESENKVYTTRQAMQYLNVSRSTLQRWRKEGKLKSIKVDSKVLFRQEDLDEMLTQNLSE